MTKSPRSGACCEAIAQGWYTHDDDCTGFTFPVLSTENGPRMWAIGLAGFIGATIPSTVLFTIAIIGGELLFTMHHNYWLPIVIAWTLTVGMMMARRD